MNREANTDPMQGPSDPERTLVSAALNQRRQAIRQLVTSGEIPGLPALSDAEAGAEAVRLVEESRVQRADPAR